MDSNGIFIISQKWRIYGVLYIILFMLVFVIGSTVLYKSKTVGTINIEDNLAIIVSMCNYISQISHFVLNFVLLHTKGEQIVKCLREFNLELTTKQKFFIVPWLFHCLAPIALLGYSMPHSILYKTETLGYVVIYLVSYKLWVFYQFWVLSFITWIISLQTYQQMTKIKSKIKNQYQNKSIHRISDLKESYLKIRDNITEINESLSLLMIVDITVTIFLLMLSIWGFALCTTTHESIRRLADQFIFNALSSSIKLVVSCLINGLVHDESDAIHKILDKINAQNLSEIDYKELVLFKTISRGQSFGFTVGGFGSLRKSTLIQIFTFILNYTVILLQTAK